MLWTHGLFVTLFPEDWRRSKGKDKEILWSLAIPQCLGAVDGTHIDIKQPSDNASHYITQENYM